MKHGIIEMKFSNFSNDFLETFFYKICKMSEIFEMLFRKIVRLVKFSNLLNSQGIVYQLKSSVTGGCYSEVVINTGLTLHSSVSQHT